MAGEGIIRRKIVAVSTTVAALKWEKESKNMILKNFKYAICAIHIVYV